MCLSRCIRHMCHRYIHTVQALTGAAFRRGVVIVVEEHQDARIRTEAQHNIDGHSQRILEGMATWVTWLGTPNVSNPPLLGAQDGRGV